MLAGDRKSAIKREVLTFLSFYFSFLFLHWRKHGRIGSLSEEMFVQSTLCTEVFTRDETYGKKNPTTEESPSYTFLQHIVPEQQKTNGPPGLCNRNFGYFHLSLVPVYINSFFSICFFLPFHVPLPVLQLPVTLWLSIEYSSRRIRT